MASLATTTITSRNHTYVISSQTERVETLSIDQAKTRFDEVYQHERSTGSSHKQAARVARDEIEAMGLTCGHNHPMVFCYGEVIKPYFRHANDQEADERVVALVEHCTWNKDPSGNIYSNHRLVQEQLRDRDYAMSPLRFLTKKNCGMCSVEVFKAGSNISSVLLEVRELNAANGKTFVSDVVYYSQNHELLCRVEVVHSHRPETERREGVGFLVVAANSAKTHFDEGKNFLFCESSHPETCVGCAERAQREAEARAKRARGAAKRRAEAEAARAREMREYEQQMTLKWQRANAEAKRAREAHESRMRNWPDNMEKAWRNGKRVKRIQKLNQDGVLIHGWEDIDCDDSVSYTWSVSPLGFAKRVPVV